MPAFERGHDSFKSALVRSAAPGAFDRPQGVRIFDTTLRDGEQAPGAGLTAGEKLEVARQLARLGVDVIEAGFPAASPGDFAAVAAIAREIGNGPGAPAIAALARARDGDPQRALEAISGAAHPHLHIFIATSDIHLTHKLRISREQALADAVHWVKWGRANLPAGAELEFSAEDATRTDLEYLLEVYEAVVAAGATTVNVPDTVGYAIPSEFGDLVAAVVDRVGKSAAVSVHCHNDLGLATANTLAAVAAGAHQVEVTINGLGERAGNASLEEVVMALRTRQTLFAGRGSGVRTEQITAASHLVSALTGFAVQPNKAIVGRNAFAHESGIHQDGMLKNPLTYEIMTPESVGLAGSTLSIGKLSGRKGLAAVLAEIGYAPSSDAELDELYRAATALADTKKSLTRADVAALVENRAAAPAAPTISVTDWEAHSGPAGGQAHLALVIDGVALEARGAGNGPVDALFNAIEEILSPRLGWWPVLLDYDVAAVSGGEDAQGRATVHVRRSIDPEDSPGVAGSGLSTDIVAASIAAYFAAIERLRTI